MKEWYLDTPTPNVCSGYESEIIDEYGISNFADVMYTGFSDSVTKCNYDNSVESTVNVVIQGVVQDSVTSTTQRQLLCNIGSFEYGDYVYFENSYWLAVAKPSNNKVYEKAIVEICDYTLKFQSEDGTILSYPCIDSNSSSTGIDEGNVITIGNSVHTIKLPFDTNTVLLDVDRRLIIDDASVKIPQVFAISKPNRTEFKYGNTGLIELTLKQDTFNSTTDRQDLGICNYFEPTATPTTPDGTTYAELSINGDLILGGNSRTITATFYNANDTVNDTVVAVWNVVLPSGYEEYFAISYDDNTCMIQVSDDDYNLIGKTVIVNVSDGNEEYIGQLSIAIGSGW